jgi:signal transduction histidine kinase
MKGTWFDGFSVSGVVLLAVVAERSSATAQFTILASTWRRWWPLALAALVIASIVYEIYRRQLEPLLELERVRTRIASDLHDDIGSGLTKISLESEVARSKITDPILRESLQRIANTSRELVDSMSDIVCAIDPKRSDPGDLAIRMRHFANQMLSAAGLEVDFQAPLEWSDASLRPELRRDVFLILKESINNTVRHSQCRQVEIRVELRDSSMLMRIRDDGVGFDPEEAAAAEGHGLSSMRARAAQYGGRLEVTSQPGEGATVVLHIPLKDKALGARNILACFSHLPMLHLHSR